jgi:hypothetical protein
MQWNFRTYGYVSYAYYIAGGIITDVNNLSLLSISR